MTAWLLSVGALIVGGLSCWLAFKARDWSSLLMHGVLVITYPVDALNVIITGRIFLAFSQGPRRVDAESLIEPAGFVFVFFLLMHLVQVGRHISDRGSGTAYRPAMRGPEPLVRLGVMSLIVLVSLAIFLAKAGPIGYSHGLQNRSSLVGSEPVLLLVFHCLPVACLYLFVAGVERRGGARVWAFALALSGVGVVFLLGSRSALLLSWFLPLVVLLVLEQKGGLGPTARRVLGKCMLVGSAIVILYVALFQYLSAFRGVDEPVRLLAGPDVSQFDSLVGLVEGPSERVATYGAAAVFFVPREVFDEKPLPGNAVASEVLTPERYELTGAEATAGLLGEAWLNLGWLGAMSAALLCLLVMSGARMLLRSAHLVFFVLGLIVSFRGLNIVRGDLVNIVVPLFAAGVIAVIAARRRSGATNEGSLGDGRSRVYRESFGRAPRSRGHL